MKTFTIIGAGAAGVFCAATLGRIDNISVKVLEAAESPMLKLLQTGGGRCNFTNANIDSNNPREFYPRGASFLRKPLRKFGAKSVAIYFEDLGVKSKREDGGRLFPQSDKSSDIADALYNKALKNGAKFEFGAKVESIEKSGDRFKISYKTSDGHIASLFSDYVLIATGGNIGGGLKESLEKLGHKIEKCVPSLFAVKLDTAADRAWANMSGVAVDDVEITATDDFSDIVNLKKNEKITARGAFLITLFGASGPAVLKLSSFGARAFAEKNYRFGLSINFIPTYDVNAIAAAFIEARKLSPKKMAKNVPLFNLKKSLWEFLFTRAGADSEKTWANFSAAEQKALVAQLTDFKANSIGKSAHKEEFVTCGGIALDTVDSATMESKLVGGLYFAGECLDIDAITGGFNLQAAWSCANICADSIKNCENSVSEI